MIQVVSVLSPSTCSPEFVNELWAFKCLMTSSALLTMKKHGTFKGEADLAVKVLEHGDTRRSPLPALLLHSRNSQVLENYVQSATFLERTQDETSIGKDFIQALGFYAQRAYKEFYLKAMGLVAGCKA